MPSLRETRLANDYFIEISKGEATVTFRRRMPDFYRRLKQTLKRDFGINLTATKVLRSPRTADDWP